MPFQKGRAKTGGRPKGYVDLLKRTVAQACEELNFDPIKVKILMGKNELPCTVCRGKGKTKFRLDAGAHAKGCNGKPGPDGLCKCEGISERKCQSCNGDLMEPLDPELMYKAAAEISSYIYAKRKALEVSNPDGTMRPTWEVVFVGGEDDKPEK
jgi:hypothetical protein